MSVYVFFILCGYLLITKVHSTENESLSNLIIDEQDRFTLYKLTLVDVPITVNAENFSVDLIGGRFVLIKVKGTSIEWRIKLHQIIPNDVILYPEFGVSMRSAENSKSEWIVITRIPKYYDDKVIKHVDDNFDDYIILNECVCAVSREYYSHSNSDNTRPLTQGLLYLDKNRLLESSGGFNNSYIREFELDTGKTLRLKFLDDGIFAEGITIVVEPSSGEKFIFLLTYTSHRILILDFNSLEIVGELEINYRGFGIVSNYNVCENIDESYIKYQRLWMTTGGIELLELQIPANFRHSTKVEIIKVTRINYEGFGIRYANELEYNHKNDTILANIWLTNYIVEINIEDGNCLHLWNLTEIIKLTDTRDIDVMNGIALLPYDDEILITGKKWPFLFKVILSHRKTPGYSNLMASLRNSTNINSTNSFNYIPKN